MGLDGAKCKVAISAGSTRTMEVGIVMGIGSWVLVLGICLGYWHWYDIYNTVVLVLVLVLCV